MRLTVWRRLRTCRLGHGWASNDAIVLSLLSLTSLPCSTFEIASRTSELSRISSTSWLRSPCENSSWLAPSVLEADYLLASCSNLACCSSIEFLRASVCCWVCWASSCRKDFSHCNCISLICREKQSISLRKLLLRVLTCSSSDCRWGRLGLSGVAGAGAAEREVAGAGWAREGMKSYSLILLVSESLLLRLLSTLYSCFSLVLPVKAKRGSLLAATDSSWRLNWKRLNLALELEWLLSKLALRESPPDCLRAWCTYFQLRFSLSFISLFCLNAGQTHIDL